MNICTVPYQLGVHNVSVCGKSLSLDPERRHTYPVCEVHGVFQVQLPRLSFPPIPGLAVNEPLFVLLCSCRKEVYYPLIVLK